MTPRQVELMRRAAMLRVELAALVPLKYKLIALPLLSRAFDLLEELIKGES